MEAVLVHKCAPLQPVRAVSLFLAVLVAASFLAAGCGRAQPPAGPQQANIGAFSVTLETSPSPPVSKQNVLFRLRVADDQGQPVTGGGVAVSLVMPGMDHGENVVRLSHQDDGVYEGTGIFVMAGRWAADVTIAVAGQQARGRFLLQVPR